MTALDIYLAMMSRWVPGRQWLGENCPTLVGAIELTEQQPIVKAVWERNFG